MICLSLSCKLINLINKHNSRLCFLYIIVCCCKKLTDNTLNIITDIASFRKRCCICNSKRHIKKLR